jgi:putative sterol carrier protein
MTTAQEIFNEMPARFKAEQAGDMNAVVHFNLSGEDGGQWYVQVADGAVEVHEGAPDDPTASIHMDAQDYVALSRGDLNPMTAFMSGKIRVEGNLAVVMKFQTLFA